YELYLKGRFFWFRFSQEGITKARVCFERALEKDPSFALAHSGRADALAASAAFAPPKDVFPEAKVAARQALNLDSSLSEAWISQAALLLFFDWDWAGAEAYCRKSIERNPRYVLAHDLCSLCLLTQGRFDEAISEATIGLELDPMSAYMNASVGFALYYSGRYFEAIEQLQKAVELDGGNFWSLTPLVEIYEQEGMYQQAVNHRQKLLALTGNHEGVMEIAQAFRDSGYEGVLRKCLEGLNELSK